LYSVVPNDRLRWLRHLTVLHGIVALVFSPTFAAFITVFSAVITPAPTTTATAGTNPSVYASSIAAIQIIMAIVILSHLVVLRIIHLGRVAFLCSCAAAVERSTSVHIIIIAFMVVLSICLAHPLLLSCTLLLLLAHPPLLSFTLLIFLILLIHTEHIRTHLAATSTAGREYRGLRADGSWLVRIHQHGRRWLRC